MADLLVASQPPTLGGGMRMRTYGIVRALAASGPVDFLYPDLGEAKPSREYETMANLVLHPVAPARGFGRALAYGMAMARGVPPSFARGVSQELIAAVEELADTPGRRRVIADGPVPRRPGLAARAPAPGDLQRAQPRVRLQARGARGRRRRERLDAAPLRAAHPARRLRVLDGQPQGHAAARSSSPRTRP